MTREQIVCSLDPKGHFGEGTAYTGNVLKPGMLVQVKAGAALVNGRPQYELWNGSGEMILVRENDLLGRRVSDAYAAGDHIYLYWPMPGDEVQVLLTDVAGTADAANVGDKLIPAGGTGKVVPSLGTGVETEPFTVIEQTTQIAADTLVLVRFNA